jgi:hypothetical protein
MDNWEEIKLFLQALNIIAALADRSIWLGIAALLMLGIYLIKFKPEK